MSFGPPPPPSAWTHSAMTQISRRKRKRSRLFGIVVAMALVVTVSATATWWAFFRDDTTPKKSDNDASAPRQLPGDVREVVEHAPADPGGYHILSTSVEKQRDGKTSVFPGTWLTKNTLIRGSKDDSKPSSLTGFRLKPYETEAAWELPLDGKICATTKHVTVDGRTALLVSNENERGERVCGQLVVVDLDQGKILWEHAIEETTAQKMNMSSLTISQNTAAVSWRYGSAGFNLQTGKQLWADTQASRCEDQGFAGGRELIAVVTCENTDRSESHLKVAKIDPRTGKHEWTYSPGDYGHEALYVVSTSPLVVAVQTGQGTGVTQILSIDDHGKLRASISVDPELTAIECAPEGLGLIKIDRCLDIAVSTKYAFITSSSPPEIERTSAENNVAAYDLKTGRGVARFDGSRFSELQVFQGNGENALALLRGDSFGEPSTVYELRVSGEKMEPFLFFGNTQDVKFDPAMADIIFYGGRLAVGQIQPAVEDWATYAVGTREEIKK